MRKQALLLLRKQGLLRDAPGRGLVVAPIDPDQAQHMYDMRAVIEGSRARIADTSRTALSVAAIVLPSGVSTRTRK